MKILCLFLATVVANLLSAASINRLNSHDSNLLNFQRRVKRDVVQNSESNRPMIIAVCLTISVAIVVVVVVVIVCICCRKKIGAALIASEVQEQNPPGTVYYQANQFTHKGPLKIQKQAPAQVGKVFPDEKDENPAQTRFQFTEDKNEVIDIGSEVEQVVD